jgi:CheY-like chemotaxis protein
VLAIDDQADALEVIRTMLEQCGANVSVAGSAAAAVGVLENAFAEGKRPDVILSDIGMPDEDGIALLSRIRRMECARTIPAIALTAYAGPGDTEVALAAGYDLHVPKPFTEDALRKAIEEVIQNRWRRP